MTVKIMMHAATVLSPVTLAYRQKRRPALAACFATLACGRIRQPHKPWPVGSSGSPRFIMPLPAADHGLWAHQAASFDSYTASPDYPMHISEQAAGDNQFKVGVKWH